MLHENSKKKFLFALLLAFLIHVLIFLLFFIQKKMKLAQEELLLNKFLDKKIEALKKEQKKPPVIFQQEEPQPEPQPQPIIPPLDSQAAALIPGASSEKTIVDAGNQKTVEIKKSDNTKKDGGTEKKVTEPSEHIASIKPAEQQVEQPATMSQKREGVTLLSEKPVKKKKINIQQTALPVILKHHYPDAPKLKNVIEGFTQFMHEEGNNAFLERAGNKNGIIDFEEAKLLTYYNKVIEFFRHGDTSYPDYLARELRYYAQQHPQAVKLQTLLKLVIDKAGNLEKITILESSGIQEYDRYIEQQFRKAAPFPPIAKHIHKEKIIFPIYIYQLLKEPPGSRFFF